MDFNMICYIIFLVVLALGVAIFFGVMTNRVITEKGYSENWFLWGFLFGVIALIVAAMKPQVSYDSSREEGLLEKRRKEDMIAEGGWTCAYCNQFNAFNVTSCSCGRSKEESEKFSGKKQPEKELSELEKVELLQKYKELLENGTLTQAEFEAKKKAIL